MWKFYCHCRERLHGRNLISSRSAQHQAPLRVVADFQAAHLTAFADVFVQAVHSCQLEQTCAAAQRQCDIFHIRNITIASNSKAFDRWSFFCAWDS